MVWTGLRIASLKISGEKEEVEEDYAEPQMLREGLGDH